MTLPVVPSVALIQERLALIFPQGTAHRNYVTREMAARTVFVMFYVGAIEGADRWLRPSQVTDMSDAQAALVDKLSREDWIHRSMSTKKVRPTDSWYAANSREPVRDETIRSGFIPCRAVIEREGIPTTSARPKYALERSFSDLFDVGLVNQPLEAAIEAWRQSHLTKAALSRVALMKHSSAAAGASAVTVRFPDGAQRTLSAGESSVIAKAVIEEFADRFLKKPAVLWLSESGNKVVARDEALASTLGLKIDPGKALPDIILVDLGLDPAGTDMLVVFVEVVASDGPITGSRKAVLTALADDAGFDQRVLAFLTAFQDRASAPFRKSISGLAWNSFAWFASEPECLMVLREGTALKLSELRLNERQA